MTAPGEAGRSSLHDRPLLRFAIGLLQLSVDRLRGTLASLGEERAPAAPATPVGRHGLPPATVRRALVGAIVAVDDWTEAALAGRPARAAGQVIETVTGTWIGRKVRRVLAGVGARVLPQLAQLAALGAEEERRAQDLARAGLQAVFDATCARLAESEAIRRLVHEQSTGLTETLIGEIRGRSAAADDALDHAITRVFGRLRRKRRRAPRPRLEPAGATR